MSFTSTMTVYPAVGLGNIVQPQRGPRSRLRTPSAQGARAASPEQRFVLVGLWATGVFFGHQTPPLVLLPLTRDRTGQLSDC